MENGFKNWPIVKKMLIDNRLEHAALLAYSIDVSEQMFVRRAMTAYRKVEVRVDDQVAAINDALDAAVARVRAEEERAASEERAPQQATAGKTDEDEPDVVPPKTEGSEP